jgi:hypothetical protein
VIDGKADAIHRTYVDDAPVVVTLSERDRQVR